MDNRITPLKSFLIRDPRTLRTHFNVIYKEEVTITKFRVKDVIITKEDVSRIFNFENAIVEWIAFDENNIYNIYPSNKVRHDGRLEIPSWINRAFAIRPFVDVGINTFDIFVKYKLIPESVEMTAYVSYSNKPNLKHEYKILKWYPINFRYEDIEDKHEKLDTLYDRELRDLWDAIFHFNDPFVSKLFGNLHTGLTNREKDRILKKEDYLKVRAMITDKKTQRVKYDYVFYKTDLEKFKGGWQTRKFDPRIYPKCYYSIFLDIDGFFLQENNFFTIDEYLNKHLIPTLKENNIKGEIYIFCSRSELIPPYCNYHIIVKTKLTLKQWIEIDKKLLEHSIRKFYHKSQKMSVLRTSIKNNQRPFLVKKVKL